jgi:hypothetical protein
MSKIETGAMKNFRELNYKIRAWKILGFAKISINEHLLSYGNYI